MYSSGDSNENKDVPPSYSDLSDASDLPFLNARGTSEGPHVRFSPYGSPGPPGFLSQALAYVFRPCLRRDALLINSEGRGPECPELCSLLDGTWDCHDLWRYLDDKYMRPYFGGRGFDPLHDPLSHDLVGQNVIAEEDVAGGGSAMWHAGAATGVEAGDLLAAESKVGAARSATSSRLLSQEAGSRSSQYVSFGSRSLGRMSLGRRSLDRSVILPTGVLDGGPRRGLRPSEDLAERDPAWPEVDHRWGVPPSDAVVEGLAESDPAWPEVDHRRRRGSGT
eukprot:TRINITY_DN824_c0_g2_i1.p1 TRINITY_DN824_c0_g2~~TRINITY_DN824_c0_g2_i1.p1  ORF type:complete len:279 (-),score=24.63 TRINITY_DN824_c0_g2_i1:572-1408(-)